MLAFAIRYRHPVLVLAITLSITAVGHALSLVPASLEDLCAYAHRIVRGQCLQSVIRTDSATGRVFAYSTFRIDEVLTGPPGETVVLRVIHLGETFAHANGLPKFRSGDQALLFLTAPNQDGYPYLVGLGMGCYHVRGATAQQHIPVRRGIAGSGGVSGMESSGTWMPATTTTALSHAIRSILQQGAKAPSTAPPATAP